MRKFWLLCLFLLTACGTPPHAISPSTPEMVNVALTPSLRPFAEVLHTCAAAYMELTINIVEVPASAQDIQTADLVIRLGGTPGGFYAAPIGEESVVLIVNANNPVLAIPADKLRDLFTGLITSWAEVGGTDQPVQVWSFPEGDDARAAFDAVIFPGEDLTPQALLAPNPQAMLGAVADDPLAIGYVPQNWLTQMSDEALIRPLSINQKLVEQLHQPVLALSRVEPKGSVQQLLVCMQSVIK